MASVEAGSEFVDFLGDQLRRWARVTMRRMFGGHGLYRGSVMFGLISGDTLYFRTDEVNMRDFAEAGMPPFRYERAGRLAAALRHAAVPRRPRPKRRPTRDGAAPSLE